MNIRTITKPVLSGIIPAVIAGFAHPAQAQEQTLVKSPNIIWISTEDISPRLGCYGDPVARTPHLDHLAKQGIVFGNVYTTAAICAPVRAGIITGMYQTSIGCMHMRTTSYRRSVEDPLSFTAVPPHYVKAFTEYMRAAGYYCTNNSKTDYQFARDPVPASIWDECGKKAHYKNRQDKKQPFFAVFNYTGTHESQAWDISDVKTDPAKVVVPPYYPDNETVRKNIAKQYDNIANLDEWAGKLLDELESEGELDNTIIFFWGDHGDGLPRAKRWLYDSGLHIPLIVKFPHGYKKGTVDNRLISSIDLGPTVLSLAGICPPAHMQGRPFLGKYDDLENGRQYIFAARDRVDESYDMIRAVRNRDHLYIRNFYPNTSYNIWIPYLSKMPIMQEMLRLDAEGKLTTDQQKWMTGTRPPEELYDVKKDPYQLINMASSPEYRDILKNMRQLLDQWMIETNDMGRMNEPEMIEMMWPGKKQPVTDKPWFIINSPEERFSKNHREGGTFTAPMTLSLFCPTHGASLVYTFEEGENPRWKLYTGAIRLDAGTYTIRAKAVRYGYQESEELTGTFEIKSTP